MPDEKVDPSAPPGETEMQTAAPSYVTRDELTTMAGELTARIQGMLDGFARPGAVTPTPEPQRPSVSFDEINEAVSEGKGAEKIAQLVESKVNERLNAALREHVDPLRQHGLSNLEQIARATALNGKQHAKRFEREVDDLMKSLGPELRSSVNSWSQAYEMVRGRHADELEREAVEQAVRKAGEQRHDTTPHGGSAVLKDEDGAALPTLEELAGPDGAKVLRDKGIDLEGLAKKMGYKDSREYLKVAKMVENFDGDLI